ncbi:hypothetical protein FCM35_KLT10016 [Carex littledalei]|uniref:Uncharacterized protein n=1 Tax=Carex littledalei TaxID=544730 RepID=A0A833VHW5_9POAL|nr:hypothetical protein FCM35_KLT10016 [Carex littledalei]
MKSHLSEPSTYLKRSFLSLGLIIGFKEKEGSSCFEQKQAKETKKIGEATKAVGTKKPNEAEKASKKDDKKVVTGEDGKSKESIANKDIEETSSKGKGVLMEIVLIFMP